MHIEDEHVPIIEDAHSEYGFIGFDEREDSNNWEWKIDESPEYHPGPHYVVDDDDDDAPTWPSSKGRMTYPSCTPYGHPCTFISSTSDRLH
ncbi:hypothetical protein H5410_044769 [Solanum commersonii]|uniref:Uncharacterized protein n=1 Tax=Solanum commersonii TaxID=4109 RepID=A0A9J5X9J2_SOLCO|nr:hypothetical protein H5410_044769 [Solanum commersonii]